MLIKDDGSLAPSALYPVATGIQRPHTICTQLLRGVGTWVIELSGQPGPNEFFFKISYLQQMPTVLYFSVRDSAGREIAPATGARTKLDSQLANVYLRLPVAAPRQLVIRSENLASNVCIGAVTLGFPVPRAAK
jgi:hypothetical protein